MDKFIILILLLVNTLLIGQELKIPLLTQVQVDGKIVELQLKSQQKEKVLLGWKNIHGQQGFHSVILTPGTTVVDLSNSKGWSNQIHFLATNNPHVTATLITKIFYHEFGSFLATRNFTPRSVNMIDPYTFSGMSLNLILLIIWIGAFVILFLVRIKWKKSILISFILAWFILNLITSKNEIGILSHTQHTLEPFIKLEEFVSQAKPYIEGKSWSMDQLSGVHNSYVKYHFWEETYLHRKHQPPAELLVTLKPARRKVVFNKNGFYLVKL